MVSAVGGLSQIVNQVNGNYDYVTALAAAQTACVQFMNGDTAAETMAAYIALQNLFNVANGLNGSYFQQMATNAQNLMNDIEQLPVSFASVSGNQLLPIQSNSVSSVTFGDTLNNPSGSYSFSESVNVNDLHDTNWFTLNMDGDVFDSYTVPNGVTVNSTEQGGCTSSDDQVMSATATGEAIQQYGMVDPSNLSNSDFIAIVNAPSFLAPAPQPNT
jgi:hypothetical protein